MKQFYVIVPVSSFLEFAGMDEWLASPEVHITQPTHKKIAFPLSRGL